MISGKEPVKSKFWGRVLSHLEHPIIDAEVCVRDKEGNVLQHFTTDEGGNYGFEDWPAAADHLTCQAFGGDPIRIPPSKTKARQTDLVLKQKPTIQLQDPAGHRVSVATLGKPFILYIENPPTHEEPQCLAPPGVQMAWIRSVGFSVTALELGPKDFKLIYTDSTPGAYSKTNAKISLSVSVPVAESVQSVRGQFGARLERTFTPPTLDQALWELIRTRTHAIHFRHYQHFINRVFAHYVLRNEKVGLRLKNLRPGEVELLEEKLDAVRLDLHDVQAYETLQLATDAFLLAAIGVRPDQRATETGHVEGDISRKYVDAKLAEYLGPSGQLPYITRVLHAAFPEFDEDEGCCFDRVLTCKVNEPCLIELIWSYWHEEGMLAQTMNAVTRRFQNFHAPGGREPLAHLEIDPLRPLNNVIWGWAQDELNRLSIRRRAYEYEHEYGLRLYGRAVRGVRAADTRSKFLEAFHNLLHLSSVFFKEDNDTTVIADGYPLLNALKEVHLLLAQGAHNQFRDLPWVARREMMMQQWILARPEIRDFLQSRIMVPYKEAWMPQVDT